MVLEILLSMKSSFLLILQISKLEIQFEKGYNDCIFFTDMAINYYFKYKNSNIFLVTELSA